MWRADSFPVSRIDRTQAVVKDWGKATLRPKEISRYRDTLGKIRAAVNTAGILRYLMTAAPNRHVWHKAFYGGSDRRAGAHTHPAFPKMPTAPSAFPLLGEPQAPGDEPNPCEGGKILGGRPPEVEGNLQVPTYTRPVAQSVCAPYL